MWSKVISIIQPMVSCNISHDFTIVKLALKTQAVHDHVIHIDASKIATFNIIKDAVR